MECTLHTINLEKLCTFNLYWCFLYITVTDVTPLTLEMLLSKGM